MFWLQHSIVISHKKKPETIKLPVMKKTPATTKTPDTTAIKHFTTKPTSLVPTSTALAANIENPTTKTTSATTATVPATIVNNSTTVSMSTVQNSPTTALSTTRKIQTEKLLSASGKNATTVILSTVQPKILNISAALCITNTTKNSGAGSLKFNVSVIISLFILIFYSLLFLFSYNLS